MRFPPLKPDWSKMLFRYNINEEVNPQRFHLVYTQ
jgi:hypothetical protein